MAEHGAVVAIDFPGEALPADFDGTEVVLAMGLVVGIELIEPTHGQQQYDAVGLAKLDWSAAIRVADETQHACLRCAPDGVVRLHLSRYLSRQPARLP